MRKQCYAGFAVLVGAAALAACTTDVTTPVSELRSVDGIRGSLLIDVEKMVPDADFDEADKDLSKAACVKDTPDGDLILRDDNVNTPSQPCPPPFLFVGKGSSIPIRKEWVKEDENMNGIICVKETGADKFIVKDDNLSTPSQPCPPAFYTSGGKVGKKIPFDLAAEGDDNFNRQVCLHNSGTGNYVVKDDNLDLPSQPCPPAYSLEPVGKVKAPIEEIQQ